MSKAVVQGNSGDTASGSYDGYGRLETSFGVVEVADFDALWHCRCFALKGRPAFSGPSRGAYDQGMPPADELSEPTTPEQVDALKVVGDAKVRAAQEAHKKWWAEREAEEAAARH